MISAKGERNMLFLTCAAHRLWQGCLSAGFFLALIASAAAEDAPAEGPSAAGVEAVVTDGRLTLQADGAPLAEVLRAIGAAGGFEVVLRGAFATPVSAVLRRPAARGRHPGAGGGAFDDRPPRRAGP